MQIDFHYYCIFVLANLAGYEKKEAKIIAYSSQYVDDATESKPIHVGNYIFDTVRTAHTGLRAKRWSVCKKVTIPFHFLPAEPFEQQTDVSYITQKDSLFARTLLEQAQQDKSDLKLYRLGIALHTFADTWTHQEFSGRSHKENNLSVLKRRKNNKDPKCPLWWHVSNIASDVLYGRVGHLQALRYPDHSHCEWLYKKDRKAEPIPVQNVNRCMEASEKIFFFLAASTNNLDAKSIWESNKDKIRDLFLHHSFSGKKKLIDKCAKWQESFPEFFSQKEFEYKEDEWKNKAMKERDKKDIVTFRQTDWVKFHRAALLQRFFVLQRIT